MDRSCDRFEEFRRIRDRGCTASERKDFEEHLMSCPDCSDQNMADEAVTSLFSTTPLPELSPSFNKKLRHHIMEERSMSSRRPLLMQAYWLMACIISVIVLLDMEVDLTNSMTALVFLLFCFAVPMLLLGRMLRFNLFDLILASVNRHPSASAVSREH